MSSGKSIKHTLLRTLANKRAVLTSQLRDCVLPDSSTPDARYAVTRAVKSLVEQDLAEILTSDSGEEYLRLTAEGKKKLASLELSQTDIPVPTTWDGKWRIVILDLPESRKSEREALRYLLKKAGFVCVKNTVWVSPYPFEHFFINIKRDLGLSNEIMVLVTDSPDPETQSLFKNL